MLGAALVGCARQGSARPTLANSTIHLVWAASWQGVGSASLKFPEFAQPVVAQWEAAHPGVQVRVITGSGSNGSSIGQTGTISSILAGNGPDVFSGCCADWPAFLDASLFLPLEPFIRQNNIDTSIWSKGHLQALTDPLQGILALPLYDGPVVYVYNQGLLDELGLEYPPPTWTYRDAAQLWARIASSKGGKRRYGAYLRGNLQDLPSVFAGFGGSMMDSSATKPGFASPANVTAYEWMLDLAKSNAVQLLYGFGAFADGGVAFATAGGWTIQQAAQTFQNMKWDYLPVPTYPAGKATFDNDDFYGINAGTKRPDLAWELLQWICAEPQWQKYFIRITLAEPSLLSLWGEWESLIRAVAPPMNNKSLHFYRDAAVQGYAWPQRFFRWSPTQADTTITTWLQQLQAYKISVPAAFAQIDKQLGALETATAGQQPPSFSQMRAAVDKERQRLQGMFQSSVR